MIIGTHDYECPSDTLESSFNTVIVIVGHNQFISNMTSSKYFFFQFDFNLQSFKRMCCSFDRVIQEQWCSLMSLNRFSLDTCTLPCGVFIKGKNVGWFLNHFDSIKLMGTYQ